MKTLGYGVIGCGNVSDRHLDAVEQGAGMRLAAVVDKQVERAKQMAGKHPSRPVVYGDVDDLLADDGVEVVVICLPSQLHAQTTVAAANAGKHIYCEKVMAGSVNEAREMIAVAEENGVKLMIGHNTRYFPAFAQARRLIAAGEIGDIVAVDGAFPNRASLPDAVRPTFWGIKAGARGHGIVMNFGCHYADTARYLCGEGFARVSAHIGNRYSEGRAPEDQYVITALTESGIVVTIAHYGLHAQIRSRNTGFTIYGTHGILEAFYFPDAVAIRRAGDDSYRDVQPDADLTDEGPWERLHRELREAIEEDTEPSVTGDDGLQNIEWALGAYLSHERRTWIELPLAEEYWDYCGPALDESLPLARDWDVEG
ncbi:MAG: Gfo/Idh/MocA family oxidoreductase [Candidatus Latescibacteria bacterium]|nr:Gfo/Idh/MocA family oxidoreductase [Candidatus Latescibacterota bacterium]